jgi:hypothetical protein
MNNHNKSWTPEEDELLLSLVQKHHDPKAKRHTWSNINNHFGRTEKSVAQRYYMLKKQGVQTRLKLDTIPTVPKTTKSFLWGLYTVTREG